MMAARLRKSHQEDVRLKIQASQLINRLTDHVFDRVEMKPTQISAAIALLKKSVPDLQSVQHTGGVEVKHSILDVIAAANKAVK